MWGHMGDYGWGGMWLGMAVFWGLLAAAVVVFVRYTMRRDDTSGREPEKSALDILKGAMRAERSGARNSSRRSSIWRADKAACNSGSPDTGSVALRSVRLEPVER